MFNLAHLEGPPSLAGSWCSDVHRASQLSKSPCWHWGSNQVLKAVWRPPSGTHWEQRQKSSQVFARKPNVSSCQFCAFEDMPWGRLRLENVSHARDKLWILSAFRSSWRKDLKYKLNQPNSSHFKDTDSLFCQENAFQRDRVLKQSVCWGERGAQVQQTWK